MQSVFEKWLVSLLVFVSFKALGADEWSGAFSATLRGKLIKKYFQAPRVIQNPPFGWFVELDEISKGKVFELYSSLSEKEKALFSDLHLQYVRLSANKFATLEWARDHCNEKVVLKGEILEPDLFGEFRSFYFNPEEVVPAITEQEKAEACLALNEVIWKSKSSGWSEEDLADESLVLSGDKPERFVSMTGTLTLRILNSDPDSPTIESGGQPLYCWFLKMDPESFKLACSTPVRMSFQTPATIRSFLNCHELELTGSYDQEWLMCHVDQITTIQGYLWHAHTGHHHTPVMLGSAPLSSSTQGAQDDRMAGETGDFFGLARGV